MHSDWDLVHMDMPLRVFASQQIQEKGQHYIVHFSSRSYTDSTYTDAIDVNVLPTKVDPPELIYGNTTGTWGWAKTDHCQFIEPTDVVTPIRDATIDVLKCRADMENGNIKKSRKLLGINVVPTANPDVVPRQVTRSIEKVDPLCLASCAVTPDDANVKTAGFCRLPTADDSVAVCSVPARIHHVAWANPAVSGITYDSDTVSNARPGDYIAFEWDDVVHDVWLVPSTAIDPCNLTGTEDTGSLVIPPSHHATIDPTTEDTVVEGRNRYRIPAEAAGTTLLFVCSINGHCDSGQQLAVAVGATPAVPDIKLDEGVCPDDSILCPDQSKQTSTSATVATVVNLPLLDTIGADGLRLTGISTRASTPWDSWKYRKLPGKVCRRRLQNPRTIDWYPSAAGTDHSDRSVWEFKLHYLHEVVEACSSSHPETCTGISWKGGTNYSELQTPLSSRTYSDSQRTSSRINDAPGWISFSGKGAWMQLDLGSETEVTGVVTQGRGNNCCGPMGVPEFRVRYSRDGETFYDVGDGGTFYGPSEDFLTNEWASDMHRKFKTFFPTVITARYVRFIVQTIHRLSAMRADVLQAVGDDMFVGKHHFRRCLESDQYTRLVSVGALSKTAGLSFTVPSNFSKSVACPGCYQCREVPLAPNYGAGTVRKPWWGTYGWTHGSDMQGGFTPVVTNPGTDDAVLTISLPEPVKWSDWRLSWANHNPEFICRVSGSAPLEPELEDDPEWVTFLPTPPADPNSEDTVIAALAAGFQPPEAVDDFTSSNQTRLSAVYPPGEQVAHSETADAYFHEHVPDRINHSSPSLSFTVQPQVLGGRRDGGWWPPKPSIKVTFMPTAKDEYFSRLYPHGYDYVGVTKLMEESAAAGWHVDQGALESEQTNSVTGETATFGWRCQPRMAWYTSNWREHQMYEHNTWGRYVSIPPYAYGAARDIGTYYNTKTGSSAERCSDGRLNAWEVVVPNGIYLITVNFAQSGCTFENVQGRGAPSSATRDTYVYSAEVADGKFTLSAGPPTPCSAVNWLKLDLVTTKVFPKPWIPAPTKEWWQLELDKAEDVGLVEVRLPHEGFTPANTYPYAYDWSSPDCRKWWLYAPAKCYRMVMEARKRSVHPDLASYPDFPGFAQPFLKWLFDEHDTNGDGKLFYEEFRSAQYDHALCGASCNSCEGGWSACPGADATLCKRFVGTSVACSATSDSGSSCDEGWRLCPAEPTPGARYSIWSNPGKHNEKGTKNYHDDNVAHLWKKLDSFNAGYADPSADDLTRGDGVVTREEFLHGIMAMPRTSFCDIFESTEATHGGNWGSGFCKKDIGGIVPEHWGYFPDDGEHGFVVSVSNTSCSNPVGCPAGDDVVVCEHRLHRTSVAPARIDCGGTIGKYVRLTLPGDGIRLLPQGVAVSVHRSVVKVELPTDVNAALAVASTNPLLNMSCYGVEPRPVPAADDPDLLSGAKLHPKLIVDDNPQDPVFWSTCYDRVIVKQWLPLLGAFDNNRSVSGIPYKFASKADGESLCLDCESIRQNHNSSEGYNMTSMLTPRWWLQPAGLCADCNYHIFGIGGGIRAETSSTLELSRLESSEKSYICSVIESTAQFADPTATVACSFTIGSVVVKYTISHNASIPAAELIAGIEAISVIGDAQVIQTTHPTSTSETSPLSSSSTTQLASTNTAGASTSTVSTGALQESSVTSSHISTVSSLKSFSTSTVSTEAIGEGGEISASSVDVGVVAGGAAAGVVLLIAGFIINRRLANRVSQRDDVEVPAKTENPMWEDQPRSSVTWEAPAVTNNAEDRNRGEESGISDDVLGDNGSEKLQL